MSRDVGDCPCAGRATHYDWCPTRWDVETRMELLPGQLEGGVVLDRSDGPLLKEPVEFLERAVDAGILYACPILDGSCPNGHHVRMLALHPCDGKTLDDYERLVGSA